MRFRFQKRKLKRLYTQQEGHERYSPAVVDGFFEVIAQIDSARDRRDLYGMQNLRLEKLKGKRGNRGEYSMRVTGRMRLVLTFEEDEKGPFVCIREIVDYH